MQKRLVKCKFTFYNLPNDSESSAKGLQRLFQHDDGSKLPPDMVARIRLILSTLQAAPEIEAMDIPTFRLHPLKGEL